MAACTADTDPPCPCWGTWARLCLCAAVAGMLRAAAPNPRPTPQGRVADDADATRPARTVGLGRVAIAEAARNDTSPAATANSLYCSPPCSPVSYQLLSGPHSKPATGIPP